MSAEFTKNVVFNVYNVFSGLFLFNYTLSVHLEEPL